MSPRRYADVESKPVADLEPGDEVVNRRRVQVVTKVLGLETSSVTVTWDDGTHQVYDLAGEPALEVVAQKSTEG